MKGARGVSGRPPAGRNAGRPVRPDFWQAKFRANVERDRRNGERLREAGWRIAVVWECSLRKGGDPGTAVELNSWLHGDEKEFETSSDGCARTGITGIP